jgi:hypothetical protein
MDPLDPNGDEKMIIVAGSRHFTILLYWIRLHYLHFDRIVLFGGGIIRKEFYDAVTPFTDNNADMVPLSIDDAWQKIVSRTYDCSRTVRTLLVFEIDPYVKNGDLIDWSAEDLVRSFREHRTSIILFVKNSRIDHLPVWL